MRLQCSAAFWALLASASPLGIDAKQGLRRQLVASNDCTIMAVEALSVEGGENPDMILECEMHPDDADGIPGMTYPIDATPKQLKELRESIEGGKVNPGQDKLDIVGVEITDKKKIKFPPGLDITSKVKKNGNNGKDKDKDKNRRRLVATTGDLKMLLVKVYDVNGLTYPDSPALMSDEVFGTGVDLFNLKSGLEACSWNQLNVVVGNNDPNEVAQGVIEVNIGISLNGSTSDAIRNAVTAAVQTKLGYTLPGPFNYVLYSLESCYGTDCGWAAYAYINHWNSVYQNYYYKRPGVLMHEIGHNFGLAHSGGLDGQTYTDHTCTMGNPHYSDDGLQCYNPAKNFQLNWYNPAKITEDPRVNGYTKTLTLVGIGEYDKALNAPIATATSGNRIYPVTVRLETGGGADYFVGFNRATGPNSLNDEGDDQVTIIQVDAGNGEGYSQSYLRARLSPGQSHNLTNFGGTGKTVTITVNSIDIATSPGKAVVTITDNYTPPPPPAPTQPPTPMPTNAFPSGPQTATYDLALKVPKCSFGSSCDSGTLLNGRGTIAGGNEPNRPNALNSCVDGDSGTYHSDESIDKIVVKRASGGDNDLTVGEVVTIEATVWCWGTGTSDFIDFYYASDAANPVWNQIGQRQTCPGGGSQVVTATYTLPQGAIQAVRVNMMYGSNVASAAKCVSGSGYDDVDDLAITVKPIVTGAPPTPPPTNLPTTLPTKAPTSFPTSPPTAPQTPPPTPAPSAPPTPFPTNVPTKLPTKFPTSPPTTPPTAPPTAPPTPLQTPPPTNGGTAQPQDAVFDTVYGAPRCVNAGSECDSMNLLNGRGTMLNGGETNFSNTNKLGNSCVDGNGGSYHSDESIDQITVTAGDIVGGTAVPSGGFIAAGGRAYVTVKVWCWSTGASDTADIYLANDASSPSYTHLASIVCPGGGAQTLRHAFDVGQGTNQSIRVNFRYGGSQSTCSSGAYDDHDDLIFTVKGGVSAPTPAPTQPPTPMPTNVSPSGPQTATYDPTLKAPKCSVGSSCNSGTLLNGRGTIAGGNEPNRPNALNSCVDGNSGTYHSDESIDKIVVRRVSGGVGDLTVGEVVTIEATVWCWGTGTSDRIDFYYASDAANPVWNQIGLRQTCPGGGLQTVTASYALPQGAIQAVRVNLMYGSNVASAAKCVSGSWDDVDDMVITVRPNPAAQGIPVGIPGKNDDVQGNIIDKLRGDADIEEDLKKKELMDMNLSTSKPKLNGNGNGKKNGIGGTVSTVDKYICAKEKPFETTICADGAEGDDICSSANVGRSCGSGGKKCWWASGCSADEEAASG